LIVDNIQALCRENKTSIWRVEQNCGIGNGTIAKWAGNSPRIDLLKKVADYFGVTVDYLLREGDPQ
jgi:transcriptional regulator with XRE-family HTH domain